MNADTIAAIVVIVLMIVFTIVFAVATGRRK